MNAEKEKIIIDTNILYSLSNLSSKEFNFNSDKMTEKVKKEILNNYTLCLSSASIIEMICKLSGEKNLIIQCLEFIKNNHIEILNTNYFSITEEMIISDLHGQNSIDYNDIRNKKMSDESDFIRGFIAIIATCFYDILEDDLYGNLNTNDKDKIKAYHYRACKAFFEGNYIFIKTVFDKYLQDAYKTKKVIQEVKKNFNNFIYLCLYNWIFTFYLLKKSYKTKNFKLEKLFDNEKIKKNAIKEVNKSELCAKIINNKDQLFNLTKGNKLYESKLRLSLIIIKDELAKEDHTEIRVINYIENKILKMFNKGSGFVKNDINDLIITYSSCINNYRLLTLDKEFIKTLKNIDNSSFMLNRYFHFD